MHWNCFMKSSRNLKKGAHVKNCCPGEQKTIPLLISSRGSYCTGREEQDELHSESSASSTSSAQNLRVHQWLNHDATATRNAPKAAQGGTDPLNFKV